MKKPRQRKQKPAAAKPSEPPKGPPANILLDDIPGLKERVAEVMAEDDRLRILAWMDCPLMLCGVRVKQLRLDHMQLLSVAGNPIMAGGIVGPLDITQFLWIVSAEFSADEQEAESFSRKAAIKAEETADCLAEISQYIDDAFLDRRPSARGTAHVPRACLAASLFHEIHRAYPRAADEILKRPIAAILQLVRLLDEDAARKHGYSIPTFSRADRVRKEMVNAHLASFAK